MMRFLFSIATFILTMILALLAFTYTLIHYPTTMRDLLTWAQHIREQVQQLTLPDNYMVWVDILLQPNQIVLVGFSIAMRILLGIFVSLFGSLFNRRGSSDAAATTAANSPFSRWG